MQACDLTGRVVAAFLEECPSALLEFDPPCHQAAIERDGLLMDEALGSVQTEAASHGSSLLRLWNNRPCVVLPQRFRRRLADPDLVDFAASQGYAVGVRGSGGTVVVHRPGILNISLLRLVPAQAFSTQQIYRPLVDLIARAMLRLGLQTGCGPVAGSFCDGMYNVTWQARKLAGTSGQVRQKNGYAACLAHAYLTINGDLQHDVQIVQKIEQMLDLKNGYSPDAHVSVLQAVRLQRALSDPASMKIGRRVQGCILA